MLQYTNFKLALLAAADTEPGTVYSHPFEEGLYVVPETRAEEQRLRCVEGVAGRGDRGGGEHEERRARSCEGEASAHPPRR